MSLEIFCLLCGNGSFGGKGKGSLEANSINQFPRGGWKLGGSCVHNKIIVDPHRPS